MFKMKNRSSDHIIDRGCEFQNVMSRNACLISVVIQQTYGPLAQMNQLKQQKGFVRLAKTIDRQTNGSDFVSDKAFTRHRYPENGENNPDHIFGEKVNNTNNCTGVECGVRSYDFQSEKLDKTRRKESHTTSQRRLKYIKYFFK
uniref:Uncharacterized protein n=1 Tax=Romanomermis culicivorax TaxID=13658 RepID=A0A915HZ22_ROMCU